MVDAVQNPGSERRLGQHMQARKLVFVIVLERMEKVTQHWERRVREHLRHHRVLGNLVRHEASQVQVQACAVVRRSPRRRVVEGERLLRVAQLLLARSHLDRLEEEGADDAGTPPATLRCARRPGYLCQLLSAPGDEVARVIDVFSGRRARREARPLGVGHGQQHLIVVVILIVVVVLEAVILLHRLAIDQQRWRSRSMRT